MAWNLLTKTEKTRACWLTANHHQFKWNDGHVDYGSAKRLIRDAIYRGTSLDLVTRIYVKGHEKKKWLLEILRNIAEDRDDIGRLETLDASRALRCAYHAKNCALENVCKLRDWWMERRDDLNNI
ncbi:hypothetical protein ACFW04_014395 [Cataglyphis niger]